MAESYLVFDASVVRTSNATLDTKSSNKQLSPTPGKPSLDHTGIIVDGKNCTEQLFVARLLPDGTEAPQPGFREVKNQSEAIAEAAAGKLVLRLKNNC